MADDVKIGVSAPGADRTKRDLGDVAQAERKVGRAGQESGKKAKRGARDASQGFEDLGDQLGVNTAAFKSWGVAAGLAIAGVVAAVRKAMQQQRQFVRELRQTYGEFVDLARQPETIQLAQLRGESGAATVRSLQAAAADYRLDPGQVRSLAFALESGLQMGPKGVAQVERTGMTVMRAYGAGGGTIANLALGYQDAARKLGLATTPGAYQAFLASAGAFAGKSKVSLQQLGQVAERTLSGAATAGVAPEQLLAMIASMSYSISEPGRLATGIEQMTRAAGVASPALAAAARRQYGRDLGQLSAVEIMQLQGQMIAAAGRRGGPQAMRAVAEQLQIPAEAATLYGQAFGPGVQQRMAGFLGGGAADRWAEVQGRFEAVAGSPEDRAYAARLRAEAARQQRSRRLSPLEIATQQAEAAADEARIGGWRREAWVEGQTERRLARRAEELARQFPEDSEMRRELEQAAGAVYMRDLPLAAMTREESASEVITEAESRLSSRRDVNVYQGGTHYHNADKRDPAGRAREPAGRH